MARVTIIDLGLAKNVFQAHGTSEIGIVTFRKKLTPNQVLSFLLVPVREVPDRG